MNHSIQRIDNGNLVRFVHKMQENIFIILMKYLASQTKELQRIIRMVCRVIVPHVVHREQWEVHTQAIRSVLNYRNLLINQPKRQCSLL